jgi:hypothetical protein
MTKPPRIPRDWFAKLALREARRGDPGVLCARLSTRKPLTDEEIQFIVEVLQANAGKRQRSKLRAIERYLIAAQVDELIQGGMKKEAAVAEIMRLRGCKRRKVFDAIKNQPRGITYGD